MLNVLLVIHLFVALALVAVVLLQRSEGGGLGIGGGGGGGMGGFLTGRGTANLLTRATAILAAVFFVTSLVLTKLSGTPEGVQIPVDVPRAVGQPGADVPGFTVPPSDASASPPSGTPAPSEAPPSRGGDPAAPLAR